MYDSKRASASAKMAFFGALMAEAICLWVLAPLGGTPRTGHEGTPPRRSGGRLMPGTVPVAHFHVKANGPWTGEPARGPNDPASVKSSRGLTLQPFGLTEYKESRTPGGYNSAPGGCTAKLRPPWDRGAGMCP